jgi:hypothetical protein
MNNEVPRPLNYATPVRRVYWGWPWWKRLGVAALLAAVHLTYGIAMTEWLHGPNRLKAFGIRLSHFPEAIFFPVVALIEWLRGSPYLPDTWTLPVTVGESLLVGAMLAALFEGISRYLHRPKV